MRSPWWIAPVSGYPSVETLRWVAVAVAPGARVVGGRRLTGGLVSSVYRLSVEDRNGRRQQVVLRRYVGAEHRRRNIEFVRQEARVLEALAGTATPAPRLLAVDAEGASSGGQPALLMTRLPGSAYLAPAEGESWLLQLAQVLATIHGTRIDAELPSRTAGKRRPRPGKWAQDSSVWRDALQVISRGPTPYQPTFIHGDYQHFNILWSRGRLTGVVDWVYAAMGSPDIDVGHCRLNLAVLFSADWAERFRQAYESASGRTVDPWWDLNALLNYSPDWQQFIPIQVAGRIGVDQHGMTARVEELIKKTLRRM